MAVDPFAGNPYLPKPVVVVDPDVEWKVRFLAAVDQLEAAVLERANVVLPAPVVRVDAPDLSAIVTAVQALKGPATADEIALAVRDVLQPARADDETTATLRKVADALEKLDFRLQGVGTQAYGGGSVSLDAAALAALNRAGSLIPGVDYDTTTATYPNATTEVYVKTKAGDLVETTTVTYTDSSKALLDTVVVDAA